LRCLLIGFTGVDAADEVEEDEGLGFMCTSEESEGDDCGFICAAVRFVPWVDNGTHGGQLESGGKGYGHVCRYQGVPRM